MLQIEMSSGVENPFKNWSLKCKKRRLSLYILFKLVYINAINEKKCEFAISATFSYMFRSSYDKCFKWNLLLNSNLFIGLKH